MKKIFSLAALFLAGQIAAQTRIEITRKDGSIQTYEQQTVIPDDTIHTLTLGWNDTLQIQDLKSLRYTRDGLDWNLQWKLYDNPYHNRFGYGAVMHVRDMMTADVLRPSNGYNWFGNWEAARGLGKNILFGQGVFNALRTLTIEANEWIRALKDAGEDSQGWLGAAYACRALAYLDMARMYEFLPNDRVPGISESGQDITGLTVALIDENTEFDTQTSFYSVPRATKAEAVAFIERDLEDAEQLITKLDESSHMLPHLDAVYGLKARLYLWTGDYAQARTYARKAIEATDTHIMTADEMTNPQRGFNQLSNWMWGVQHFPEDQVVTSGIVNWTSWLSNEYVSGYAGINQASVNALYIDKSLYERMTDSDVRKLLFVAPAGTTLYDQCRNLVLDMYMMNHPYASLKFRPNQGETSDLQGLCTAFPLMRVEEMYLIEAEAAAHTSPVEGAALLEAFVRANRDASYTCSAASQDDVINEVILQKRLELWGEGQVYFDLKRLNISVTRDYEDTNFPEAYRFNTVGRPAWMNFVLPVTEEQKNLAATDMNNPDPSDCYQPDWTGFMSNEDAAAAVTSDIVLHEPRFKADIPYVPLNAVSYILLQYDEAGHTDNISFSYGVQLALSPEFPQESTISITLPLSSYDVLTGVQYLLKRAGLPTSGKTTVYVRVRGKVDQTLSYFTYSNTVSFGLDVPEDDATKQTLDYFPEVTISMPGPIDEEKSIELDSVKICDVSVSGEGELKYYNDEKVGYTVNPLSMSVYYPEEFRYFQGSYSLDKNGVTANSWNEMEQATQALQLRGLSFIPRIEATASCSYWLLHNDLATRRSTERFNVVLLPNRQVYTEQAYSWGTEMETTMTSALDDARFSGPVSYQKAEGASVYRIVEPYAKRRNLLFEVDDENKVSVDSQYAYTADDGQPVRVSGSGVFEKGQFDMQLTFTKDDGTQLGTFNELFGEKSEWTILGTGYILDAFIYDDEREFPVTIMQSILDKNRFRVMHPYDEMLEEGGYKPNNYNQGPSEYMELTILPAGSEYADQTLTQEYVHFSDTRTGYYISSYDDGSSTDGEVWALFPACRSNSRDQSYWVNNIVAEYQDNGLPGEIVLAPRYYIFGVGGWNRVDVYGCISILFPGYVKADYSLGVTYAGVFTAPDGTVSAVADVEAGSDATDLRAIVWSQDDDASAIADAIAAGELEAESVEAGRIQVAFDPAELGSQLQLIVVAVAEGEAKNVATANFEYYTGADPWETLGTGYYTDDLVASVFGVEPPTYEVEIMYNSETGIYRLMNAYSNSVYPYADNDCAEEGSYIEVNAKNPNGVYIDKQELGFNWGYGDMAIQTWGARYLSSYSVEELIGYGYLGKVENGTITFPIFTRTTSDGSEAMYQGVLYMGTSGYYAGTNGKVEITLPDAPAYVKSRAKAKAEATQTRINKAHLQGEKVGKLPETQLPPRGTKGIRFLHVRDNPLPDPE